MIRHSLTLFLLLIVVAALPACAAHGGGRLAARSIGDPRTVLAGGFDQGWYTFDDRNNLTAVLLDGPIESPTRAVTIRMFWQPQAGRTPLDASATNATIHYMIFTGDNNALVGVYSGAGFLYPTSKPGSRTLAAGLWQAHLRLDVSTQGFADRLGQAVLQGEFTARRDEKAIGPVLRQLNLLVRERLGFARLVEHDSSSRSVPVF